MVHGGVHGGGRRAQALDAIPPPPRPSPWKLAGKCQPSGPKTPERKVFLPGGERGKNCIHPMCLYSKYSEFYGEFNYGGKP